MSSAVTVAEYVDSVSDKVRIERFPGPWGAVVGASLIILDLDKTAEALANSGFMKNWIMEQIKKHLRGGGEFTNHSEFKSDDEPAIVPNGESLYLRVRSTYRMATKNEVLNFVDNAEFANITGRPVTRRAQESGYVLHYHDGPELIALYDKLPRQAKTMLDLLNKTGRNTFTDASIEVVLTEGVAALKTKQAVSKLWSFYRRQLIDEGHLESTK